MKKPMILVLCVVMVLSLCACGSSENEGTSPVITGATTAATTEATTEGTAEGTAEATTEATTEATEPEQTGDAEVPPSLDKKALAESCIDKSIQELYALIGQPNSSDYASSCLGDGDDGMLYYDDFIVYTYREEDKETVSYVE